MDLKEERKAFILQVLREDSTQRLWNELLDVARLVYGESFVTVQNDRLLNDEQRLSKLWQERHFKMEWALKDVAENNGVPASPNLIGKNQCYYTYAKRARFGTTQKYVQYAGAMPKPTQFQVQLAAVNTFYESARMDFGDVPSELLIAPQVNGILLHGPLGKRFTQKEQELAFALFCVPSADYSYWIAELSLAEIIAAFEAAPSREDRVTPLLRPEKGTGTVS
jgi:hypothetical protein